MRILFLALSGLALGLSRANADTLVFTNSFDQPLPPEIQPGVAANTPVQGYAGLGPVGHTFADSFLRSPTGNTVTLTLTNLPPHTYLNIGMLFAAIDSLDGTGTYPSGDFFRVTIDDAAEPVFRESFANAVISQVQSYVPPTGGELARRVDLGFSGPGTYYTDSAYNFAIDPRFQRLAHSGDAALIRFQMEGPGVQSLDDESWAIDNLAITVGSGVQAPVITHVAAKTNFLFLTWSAVPSRNYQLQACTNLAQPHWQDVGPQVTAANDSLRHSEPLNPGNRFFRVQLLNP